MVHDHPRSADEDVARLRVAFCHTGLITLVNRGIVAWDQDENVVKKGPQFDAVPPLSCLPDDHGGELPDDYP